MSGQPTDPDECPSGSSLGDLAPGALNSLTKLVAVLDLDGTIVAVNEAWLRFGRENGPPDPPNDPPLNYLDECDAASRRGCQDGAATAAGIRAVRAGETDRFSYEYECGTPELIRWFNLEVTSFEHDGSAYLLVAHEDVTARRLADERARATGVLLRSVLESLPVGVWIQDATGKIIDVNAAGLEIWRGARFVGPDEFGVYKGWWLRTGEPIAAEEWAGVRAIKNGETSIDEEIIIECFDGSRKVILNSAIPMRDAGGKITGSIIVNQDITARVDAEKALKESGLKWHRLFEILPVGVSVLDRDGAIVDMNESLSTILGIPREGLETGRYRRQDYFSEDGRLLEYPDFPSTRAIRNNEVVIDKRMQIVTEKGPSIWVSISAAPMPLDTASAVVVTMDISERKAAEAERQRAEEMLAKANEELRLALERETALARTDMLTGVGNRRHFFELAEHHEAVARRYGQSMSVILFDIDHFKQLNDRFGHVVGDDVLRIVAQRAQRELRSSDAIARYGGEEFVVLLPQTDLQFAIQVAERIRNRIGSLELEPLEGTGVTISVGVGERRDADADLEQLIRRVDEALYRAKDEGRNRTVAG